MRCSMKWYTSRFIRRTARISILLSVALLTSCYSFKGISIDPNVHTYQVANFTDNSAEGAPVNLPDDFTFELDKKIRTETRLKQDDEPDILFEGKLTRFKVSPGQITNEESTSYNRLNVSVQIDYKNHLNPKDKWSKTFSHYEEFPADQNLTDVQDELLKKIKDKIIEDIFNKAFTNW